MKTPTVKRVEELVAGDRITVNAEVLHLSKEDDRVVLSLTLSNGFGSWLLRAAPYGAYVDLADEE